MRGVQRVECVRARVHALLMGKEERDANSKSRVLALLAAAAIVASACSSTSATPTTAPAAPTTGPVATPATVATPAAAASATGLPATDTTVYPRAETLYTSGKQWGAPSTWNPLDPNMAMGVVGLQYETLFLYDPIKDVYTRGSPPAGPGIAPRRRTRSTCARA